MLNQQEKPDYVPKCTGVNQQQLWHQFDQLLASTPQILEDLDYEALLFLMCNVVSLLTTLPKSLKNITVSIHKAYKWLLNLTYPRNDSLILEWLYYLATRYIVNATMSSSDPKYLYFRNQFFRSLISNVMLSHTLSIGLTRQRLDTKNKKYFKSHKKKIFKIW